MYIPLEHSLSRGMNMQDINSLLDACKVAAGVSSDNQLAAALGVGRSAISNYRHARALPDPVVCATIAGLSGIPLARVLGVVGEARAISREEKAVWRKLAATAMALCLAVGFALPHKVRAAVPGFDKAQAVYIMRNHVPTESGPLLAPHGNGWASGSAPASAPRLPSQV
jgi:transcriptional regulator with XRE-family HTH domain